MQMNKYVPATIAVFLWYFVWDTYIVPNLLGSIMSMVPGATAEIKKMWEVVGDVAAAAVLVAFYDKVRSVFGVGLKGGMTYGMWAGVLINFPTWLFATVYFGWPYRGTWIATCALVVSTTVAGTLIGLVYEKVGAPKAA